MRPRHDTALAPVADAERVELVDVLRGFALLGILLVNVQMFFAPIYLDMSPVRWWTSPADRVVEAAVVVVAQGKFYTLFSLLFGAGMGLQVRRIESRGGDPDRLLARRLSWLLLIGLAHAFLIWFGDILVLYAVVGFVLLAVRRLPDRLLLVGGAVAVLLPLAASAGVVGLIELARLSPEAGSAVRELLAREVVDTAIALERTLETYRTGDFFEVAGARAAQVLVVWGSALFAFPTILGLFAVGYVAGRRDWLRQPDAAAVRRWLPRLFLAALAGVLMQLGAWLYADPGVPSIGTWVGQAGLTVGGPALCLFYVGTIVILYRNATWRRRLAPLAPLGRMALTHYLTHSIVFTTLALPWGFALYARVPPSVAVPAGVGLWLVQIPLSRFWLARFRFGPCEWLWRSLTYTRLQPMRR